MSREIITAYYNDLHRLDWKNIIGNSKLTVYHKNDQLKIGEFIDGDYIEIPNYGRCDYAFLWHIIQNYDNLHLINLTPKNTSFTEYISFDLGVVDLTDFKVFMKSETDEDIVFLTETDTNNYGAYYQLNGNYCIVMLERNYQQ